MTEQDTDSEVSCDGSPWRRMTEESDDSELLYGDHCRTTVMEGNTDYVKSSSREGKGGGD